MICLPRTSPIEVLDSDWFERGYFYGKKDIHGRADHLSRGNHSILGGALFGDRSLHGILLTTGVKKAVSDEHKEER